MNDPVRDEAERLVAAAIAAVSTAARSIGGDRIATGTAECCICPICRVIAALREPSPDFTEKLASGAGELAAGVAALLRTLATTGRAAAEPEPEPRSDGEEFWERMRAQAQARYAPHATEDAWSAATAAAPSETTPKPPMAKKAVKKAAPPAATPPAAAPAAPDAPPEAATRPRKATKKATKTTRTSEGDG
jgi:hypothetical protein